MPLFLPVGLIAYPNEHRDRIGAHFGAASADFAAIPATMRFVFVCFTNRCGSHFLAEALASSHLLNGAGEMFNAETVIADSDAHDLRDLGQYIGFLTRNDARNGILVSKLSVTQLAMLAQAGILERISERASYIVLERDDKLGQAVSYALALGTGQWTSAHRARLTPDQVPYSADVISGFIDGIATEMALFQRFFGMNGIVPLHVSYEMLDAMPEVIVARIGTWLGLPNLRFVRHALRLRRQADETNWAWRERFLAGREG